MKNKQKPLWRKVLWRGFLLFATWVLWINIYGLYHPPPMDGDIYNPVTEAGTTYYETGDSCPEWGCYP